MNVDPSHTTPSYADGFFTVRFLTQEPGEEHERQRLLRVPAGTALFEAAAMAGVPIRNDCGGAGICRKCRVEIVSEFTTASRAAPHESQASGSEFREVLACRETVRSDLVVRIPEAARLRSTPRILTSYRQGFDPTKIIDGSPNTVECSAAKLLPEIWSQGKPAFALALDIGTTTVALELLDLRTPAAPSVAAWENPQKRGFGDDILSRIRKVQDDPDNLDRQRALLRESLDAAVDRLTAARGIDRRDILLLSVAGNSVMELIAHGLDVTPLGRSPFEPPQKRFEPVPASTWGIALHPEALVLTLPLIGGFVGGDITAGILANRLAHNSGPSLLLDIGTNGEMVLACGGRLFATATAAGPALEGARIHHGMIAAPGAVDRVFLEDGILHVETVDDAAPVGICGSGLVDAVAALLDAGLLDSSGRLQPPADAHDRNIPCRFVSFVPPGAQRPQPAVELVSASQSGRSEAVLLTQQDIRQVQLAVGAIRAGIRLLLRHADLTPGDLQTVFLAGGFGNSLHTASACRLGLLPADLPPKRIISSGNSSLAGAVQLLRDGTAVEEARRIAATTEHLDLSAFADFSTVFAESMSFPGP